MVVLMATVLFPTSDMAIRYAWRSLMSYGNLSAPRGQGIIETLNWSCEIQNPSVLTIDIGTRKMRDFIGAVESLQLVGQSSVPDLIQERCPSLHRFTDDGTFDGAYGLRIHGMLARVVALLQEDPDTRRAVLSIYDTREDLSKDTRDVPCTQGIQFLLRGGVLNMRVTMRSNDAWLGLPYDLIQFQVLLLAVSAALGVEPGTYHHSVGSLHLYDQHVPLAKVAADSLTLAQIRGAWRPGSIEEISRRARGILADDLDYDEATQLELWLSRAINDRRNA
jgi:thymidylate synthase